MAIADSVFVIKLPIPSLLELSIARFRLEQHISEIKLLLYHLPTRTHSFVWPTNLIEIQTIIKTNLDEWLSGVQQITAVENIDDQESAIFHLQKMKHEQLYYSAVCLLFQPSQSFPSPSQEALKLCYNSCSKRLQIYDAVSSQEMLYYNWRNIHGIFSSGATIVYCAWSSEELQRTVPFSKLLRDLRTCSNHLSIGSQWWPSVRSGKESFEMMIDLIIKHFSDLQLHISDARSSTQKKKQTPNLNTDNSQPPPSYSSVYTLGKNSENQDIAQSGQRHSQPHQFDLIGQDGSFGIRKSITIFSPLIFLEISKPLTKIVNGDQQTLEGMDLSMSADPLQDFDSPTIEVAMENFMADYLHEDWGWDPFSSSTGMFDFQGSGAG